jgi:hypothetical protein
VGGGGEAQALGHGAMLCVGGAARSWTPRLCPSSGGPLLQPANAVQLGAQAAVHIERPSGAPASA